MPGSHKSEVDRPRDPRLLFRGLTSEAEIKRAYRKEALRIHPDRGGTTEAMVKLTAAYDEAIATAALPEGETFIDDDGNEWREFP